MTNVSFQSPQARPPIIAQRNNVLPFEKDLKLTGTTLQVTLSGKTYSIPNVRKENGTFQINGRSYNNYLIGSSLVLSADAKGNLITFQRKAGQVTQTISNPEGAKLMKIFKEGNRIFFETACSISILDVKTGNVTAGNNKNWASECFKTLDRDSVGEKL